MPLLMSPIDGSPMKQINRYGIEIDVCPTTGGIWLDKGELEKLMAILKEEAMGEQTAAPYGHDREAARGARHDHDDDRYEQRDGRSGKKSKMSRMMDIFDF